MTGQQRSIQAVAIGNPSQLSRRNAGDPPADAAGAQLGIAVQKESHQRAVDVAKAQQAEVVDMDGRAYITLGRGSTACPRRGRGPPGATSWALIVSASGLLQWDQRPSAAASWGLAARWASPGWQAVWSTWAGASGLPSAWAAPASSALPPAAPELALAARSPASRALPRRARWPAVRVAPGRSTDWAPGSCRGAAADAFHR